MNTYYTIDGRNDGFGAQYQSIMSGIAFCEAHGYFYIHTPFQVMGHNVNIDELNYFIGIPYLHSTSYLPKQPSIHMIHEPFSRHVHYSQEPSIYYTQPVLTKLRAYYYSTEKPACKPCDIAIHIRRGDVNMMKHPDRFTSNDTYRRLIDGLKQQYPNYNITIFSEGDISEFCELESESNSVEFRLNEHITTTFHSLVTAKILVTSVSSFSYCAAILNTNTVYYMDFWHKPLNHWKNITSLLN